MVKRVASLAPQVHSVRAVGPIAPRAPAHRALHVLHNQPLRPVIVFNAQRGAGQAATQRSVQLAIARAVPRVPRVQYQVQQTALNAVLAHTEKAILRRVRSVNAALGLRQM